MRALYVWCFQMQAPLARWAGSVSEHKWCAFCLIRFDLFLGFYYASPVRQIKLILYMHGTFVPIRSAIFNTVARALFLSERTFHPYHHEPYRPIFLLPYPISFFRRGNCTITTIHQIKRKKKIYCWVIRIPNASIPTIFLTCGILRVCLLLSKQPARGGKILFCEETPFRRAAHVRNCEILTNYSCNIQ